MPLAIAAANRPCDKTSLNISQMQVYRIRPSSPAPAGRLIAQKRGTRTDVLYPSTNAQRPYWSGCGRPGRRGRGALLAGQGRGRECRARLRADCCPTGSGAGAGFQDRSLGLRPIGTWHRTAGTPRHLVAGALHQSPAGRNHHPLARHPPAAGDGWRAIRFATAGQAW